MGRLHLFGTLLKDAFNGWNRDQAMTLSAALAYYTAFSIAPLLVIAIGVVGMIFGNNESSSAIYSTVEQLLGPTGARGIESLVASAAKRPDGGLVATILGGVTLLLGASGVFAQLQQSLDLIWHVQAKPGRTLWSIVRQRLLSFSMVAVIAFILLVSLLMSAAIAAAGKFVEGVFPSGPFLWHAINVVVSLGVVALVFASIYKILPDVKLSFRDVWRGALLTALLFTLGKTLIGLYLGHSGTATSYGAAGSFVIVLVWVYYSALIFYFGAELTRADVLRRRRGVECKDIAEPMGHAPWAA